MKSKHIALQFLVLLIFVVTTAGCDSIMSSEGDELKGSGVVEVVEVGLSLETGGQIDEFFVN